MVLILVSTVQEPVFLLCMNVGCVLVSKFSLPFLEVDLNVVDLSIPVSLAPRDQVMVFFETAGTKMHKVVYILELETLYFQKCGKWK